MNYSKAIGNLLSIISFASIFHVFHDGEPRVPRKAQYAKHLLQSISVTGIDQVHQRYNPAQIGFFTKIYLKTRRFVRGKRRKVLRLISSYFPVSWYTQQQPKCERFRYSTKHNKYHILQGDLIYMVLTIELEKEVNLLIINHWAILP